MLERLRSQRLLALFCAGLALFNFPLLALWDRDVTVLGVPLFPAALFALWALLILLLAAIVDGPDVEP
jgi:hypothetical protein